MSTSLFTSLATSIPIELDISIVGMLCTLALTIVGVIGIRIAVRTLNAVKRQADIMERQTKATEIAANAAKASADSLVNAERAWIDGEIVKNESVVTRHLLQITNHGRTPARLINYEVSSGLLTEGVEFSPQSLSTITTRNLYVLLGADKTKDLEEFNIDELFANLGVSSDTNAKGIFCVKVRYTDVVGGNQEKPMPRETSFVYYYGPLLSYLERISFYNEYT